MNCKILNAAPMNACDFVVQALIFNFYDTITFCPPVITKIAPQNRLLTIAPTPVIIISGIDEEVISPWQ